MWLHDTIDCAHYHCENIALTGVQLSVCLLAVLICHCISQKQTTRSYELDQTHVLKMQADSTCANSTVRLQNLSNKSSAIVMSSLVRDNLHSRLHAKTNASNAQAEV